MPQFSDLESDDEAFVQALARHLLWVHLTRGSGVAWVEMTNQSPRLDAVTVAFLVPNEGKLAAWQVHFPDPDDTDGTSPGSQLFYDGIVNRWPDEPTWSEFSFGRVWPRPLDPEDDYEFERLLEEEWAGEWPSLLEGAGYEHWAMLGMAARGRIGNRELVEYLRQQDGLWGVGDVEVLAVGEPPSDGEALQSDEAGSIITMLARLRSIQAPDSRQAFTVAAAHLLIEPLLVVTPGVPAEILEFIATDTTCPAMHMLRLNTELPEAVKALASGSTESPVPTAWEIEVGVTGIQPRLALVEHDADTSVTFLDLASPDADRQRLEITALLGRILAVVHEPDETAVDDSLEASVGRHQQFLQSRRWLRGDIGVPGEMLDLWTVQLSALTDQLEEDDVDVEEVARLAFESWAVGHRASDDEFGYDEDEEND
jgi:hypothetical protein